MVSQSNPFHALAQPLLSLMGHQIEQCQRIFIYSIFVVFHSSSRKPLKLSEGRHRARHSIREATYGFPPRQYRMFPIFSRIERRLYRCHLAMYALQMRSSMLRYSASTSMPRALSRATRGGPHIVDKNGHQKNVIVGHEVRSSGRSGREFAKPFHGPRGVPRSVAAHGVGNSVHKVSSPVERRGRTRPVKSSGGTKGLTRSGTFSTFSATPTSTVATRMASGFF